MSFRRQPSSDTSRCTLAAIEPCDHAYRNLHIFHLGRELGVIMGAVFLGQIIKEKVDEVLDVLSRLFMVGQLISEALLMSLMLSERTVLCPEHISGCSCSAFVLVLGAYTNDWPDHEGEPLG